MSKQEFIETIAKYVQEYAPEFGIEVCSPIIAQTCIESCYGTSNKAKYNNFFGMKYRPGRLDCHSGYFNDSSMEQLSTGEYVPTQTDWYSFSDIKNGVKGYFQYTNIARYDNIKHVKDPLTYITNLRNDGYATSLTYIDTIMKKIQDENLTRFDNIKEVTKMSNSSLVTYTNLTKNHSGKRTHAIDTVTIHCTAGCSNSTAKGTVDYFASITTASSNYVVGGDGSIGQSVLEENRAWTTGGHFTNNGLTGNLNDQRAVTIEVASNTDGSEVTDKAYNALIELVADICKRNNIAKLVWSDSKYDRINHRNGCNMTVHRDYANKSCPGPYLYARMGDIANKVNAKLNPQPVAKPQVQPQAPTKTLYKVQVGAYSVKANADAQLAKIKKAGYDAFITKANVNGKELYRVQCGAFSNRLNAIALLERLNDDGIDGFIATVIQ